MRKYLIGTAAAAVLSLTTACGTTGTDDMTAASSTQRSTAGPTATAQRSEHNDVDVRFARSMIPHHQQAVAMAEMALQRSHDQTLRELAKQIKAAQAPEIRQLRAMLNGWDVATAPTTSSSSHMNPGSFGAGMMTDEQMQRLKQASGTEFHTLWLRMMIKHHEGAIEMAKKELAGGSNPAARKLARAIIEAQQTEIQEMQNMLPS